MDILAHAVYGATFFSRSGLAGGRLGPATRPGTCLRDWTVWVAAGFGLLPDMTSIGLFFCGMLLRGDTISFHRLPPAVFVLYHCTHSLVIAGLLIGGLSAMSRRLAVLALAWPLHIIMDSISHGEGRWQTLLLYPVSGWHYHGVNWWQNPALILTYWGLLPLIWLAICFWRRESNTRI